MFYRDYTADVSIESYLPRPSYREANEANECYRRMNTDLICEP